MASVISVADALDSLKVVVFIMSCTHVSNCELFAQFAQNPALILWKTHYCHAGFQSCARYQRSLVGDSIPLTLLPNGKSIETTRTEEEMGGAALFNAIQKNRPWMVKTFLDKVGVDINTTNVTGLTALMIAAEVNNAAITRILLEHHADRHMANINGETALDIARRKGHKEVMAILNGQTNHNSEARPVASR